MTATACPARGTRSVGRTAHRDGAVLCDEHRRLRHPDWPGRECRHRRRPLLRVPVRKSGLLLGVVAAAAVVLFLLLNGESDPIATTTEGAVAVESSGSDRAAPLGGSAAVAQKRPAAPPALVRAPVEVDYALIDKARSLHDATPVHDEQIRDESWAPAMESTLQAQLEKDVQRLVPGAVVEVDCRTLSCRVELSGVAEDKRVAAMAGMQIAAVAEIQQFETADNGNLVNVVFFSEGHRDVDKWQKWYAEQRARHLRSLRASKHPMFPSLPDE